MNLREATDLVTDLVWHDYEKGVFKSLEDAVYTTCTDCQATNPNINLEYLLKCVWLKVRMSINQVKKKGAAEWG